MAAAIPSNLELVQRRQDDEQLEVRRGEKVSSTLEKP